jgi:hypothetical protein
MARSALASLSPAFFRNSSMTLVKGLAPAGSELRGVSVTCDGKFRFPTGEIAMVLSALE